MIKFHAPRTESLVAEIMHVVSDSWQFSRARGGHDSADNIVLQHYGTICYLLSTF